MMKTEVPKRDPNYFATVEEASTLETEGSDASLVQHKIKIPRFLGKPLRRFFPDKVHEEERDEASPRKP